MAAAILLTSAKDRRAGQKDPYFPHISSGTSDADKTDAVSPPCGHLSPY
jgi:hypothetical protein